MLLAIDVGNTNTQLGIFGDDRDLVAEWRLSTAQHRTIDEMGLLARELFALAKIDPGALSGIVAASVVPPLNGVIEGMARRYFGLEALMVTPELVDDLQIKYEPPGDVGADRVVNAVAARAAHGVPVVVVDFGTATTFDVIDAQGAYLGGVIATGIGVSADALFAHAARLPRVDVVRPDRVIGRSTVTSIQSGIFFGYADLVDGLLRRIGAELGGEPTVVATGGWAKVIGSECQLIDTVDELLTLRGLRIIYERHAGC